MKSNTLLVALLLAISGAPNAFSSESPLHDAIFNGNPLLATQPTFKAIVKIVKPDGGVGCTGTLISRRVILTAGHCVRSGFGAPGTIIESYAYAGQSCARGVSVDTAYAPDAEPDGVLMLPDIALVRLDHDLCGTRPAVLKESNDIVAGSSLSAAGFGIGTSSSDNADQMQLQFLPQTKEALTALYEGEDDSTIAMVGKLFDKYSAYYRFALAENPAATVCGGDSGGPVFSEENGKTYLYGAIGAFVRHSTKGIPACDDAYVQVVAPLKPNLSWIRAKIREWRPIN